MEKADPILIKMAIADLQNKCVTQAIFHKGAHIDRASIHQQNFRAKNISRLSYINDEEILLEQRNANKYGRANLPGKAMFYGATYTNEIPITRATAFMETSMMPYDKTIMEEYFTISRWRAKEDFFGLELVFQDDDMVIPEHIKKARAAQISFMNEFELNETQRKEVIEQLAFFSNQFGKVVLSQNPYDYKITSTFADILLNHKEKREGFVAITYPSVKSKLLGQNIAITPEGVDKFLMFEKAVVMKAERKPNGEILIEKSFDIAESCDEFGNLKWKGKFDL